MMNTLFYKNANNEICSVLANGDDNFEIPSDWIEISFDEVILRTNQPSQFHEWQEATQSWYLSSEAEAAKIIHERESLPDITQKQLRLTLIKNGIMPDMVEAQIASIPDDDKHTRLIAQTEWQYAQSFERMSESLNMIAKDLLQMDDLQIDAMWQQAMQS